MTTLHLIDDYLPGSQAWLLHLLEAQTEVEQYVLARQYLPVKGVYLPSVGYLSHPQGHYYLWKQQLGSGFTEYLLRAGLKGYEYLRQRSWQRQLQALISAQRIDILHAHFAHTACRYIPLAKALKLPLVVSFYGHDYEKIPFQQAHYRSAYRALFVQASIIICEGPHGKQILGKMGCPAHKIEVVPLGIPSTWTDSPLFIRQPLLARPLRLLQVADFTPKKGQDISIQVLAKLLKCGENITLTLVGRARDPDFHARCQALVRKNKLQENVAFVPFVPYAALGQLFSQHDLFVHPSRYTAERDCEGGAPVILFDAQSAGLPVVSTWHCDIPFVIADQATGWLAPEGDVQQLAQLIIDFRALPHARQEAVSVAAKQRVREHFLVQSSAQRLEELYRSL